MKALTRYRMSSAVVIATAVAAPRIGAADPQGPPAAQGAPAPAAQRDDRMERAQFSTKRLVVEILGGAVVGSLAGYATYHSLCDGRGDCLGSALTGAAVNFAVTPLATWGIGSWMGGQGSLSWTYLGGSVAFAAFSAPPPANESPGDTISRIDTEFAIASFLLPVTSAAFYELSSHVAFTRWRTAAQSGNLAFGVVPLRDRGGLGGAMGELALRF